MKRLTSYERIKLCEKLYGNKFDYSKTDFSKVKNKTIVICKKHGEFQTNFDQHYNKKTTCKFCTNKVIDNKTFIEKANKIHNHKYDYTKTNYVNSHSKVIIICKEHGEFTQTPNSHLNGRGCPKCKIKSKLENKIEKLLIDNNIDFEKQKKFNWLGNMRLDFYLPKINTAIECQGKQHFGLGGWTKNFNFNEQYERDEKKFKLCEKNNVKMLYFTEIKQNNQYFSKIFYNIDELLKTLRYLLLNNENNLNKL